jgi:hypothetical protein
MTDFKRPISVNGVPVSLDGHTHGMEPSTSYWSDLIVPLTSAKPASTSKPTFDLNNGGYNMPDNNTTHILYFTVSMPLNWEAGTTVYPMVHVHQTRSEDPNFVMAYRWVSIGEAVSNWNTLLLNDWLNPYYGVTMHNIVYNPDGLYPYYGSGDNSELQIKLYRQNGPHDANILTTVFNLRHQCNSLGFTSLLAK